MIIFVIFYLFLGMNFCMFNDAFNDINVCFETKWHRILFRLSWIFLWPLYILWLICILISIAMFSFFKNLVK